MSRRSKFSSDVANKFLDLGSSELPLVPPKPVVGNSILTSYTIHPDGTTTTCYSHRDCLTPEQIDRYTNMTKITESASETPLGLVRFLHSNGAPVAYSVGGEGKITKDPLHQDVTRQIMNTFARDHIIYDGKVPQTEIDKLLKRK